MYINQSKNAESGFNFSNAVAFEEFLDATTSSTTSTVYQTKLQGTSVTNEAGSYILQWAFQVTRSANNSEIDYRVQWKPSTSVTWITASEINLFVGRADIFIPASGFKVVNKNSVSNLDFRVQWRRNGGGSASITDVNFYLFRIALTEE